MAPLKIKNTQCVEAIFCFQNIVVGIVKDQWKYRNQKENDSFYHFVCRRAILKDNCVCVSAVVRICMGGGDFHNQGAFLFCNKLSNHYFC